MGCYILCHCFVSGLLEPSQGLAMDSGEVPAPGSVSLTMMTALGAVEVSSEVVQCMVIA